MFRLLICPVLALFSIGCLSAQKRVDEQLPAVRQEWWTNVQHQASLPEQKLDWAQASTRVRAGNIKLRAARLDVTNAQESARQVWRDLIPTLNLRSGVNRRLGDLPSTGFSDVTFSADGFLNLPGIANFSSRRFATQLSLLRAETAEALEERVQLIELFKLFQKMGLWHETVAQAQVQERAARQLENIDPALGGQIVADLAIERVSLAQEGDALNLQFGELLGDRSRRWRVETNGLPTFDYTQFPLSDTNRVGRLQMRLVAVELAGGWAREQGIKLQYWPELFLFVTGPPLYQRAAGTERFWSVEDVRVSADVFWRLDTQGNIARQLRQEQRTQELQRGRFQLESQGLISKLLASQQLLVTAGEREDLLRRQMDLLNRLPPPADFQGWQQILTAQRTAWQQLHKLRVQRAELQTLFWFLDDAGWKTKDSLD